MGASMPCIVKEWCSSFPPPSTKVRLACCWPRELEADDPRGLGSGSAGGRSKLGLGSCRLDGGGGLRGWRHDVGSSCGHGCRQRSCQATTGGGARVAIARNSY